VVEGLFGLFRNVVGVGLIEEVKVAEEIQFPNL